MNGLVAMEWVREEGTGSPARPPASRFVNPKVHAVFAARAEQERLARTITRQQITASIRETLGR
jgi:hypothetical protein